MPVNFPHSPPKNYFYEYEEYSSKLIAIWLVCSLRFDYNLGETTRTIWGFYSPKKKVYYAPVNSKKPGKEVNIDDTSPYSAMQFKQSILESCFS